MFLLGKSKPKLFRIARIFVFLRKCQGRVTIPVNKDVQTITPEASSDYMDAWPLGLLIILPQYTDFNWNLPIHRSLTSMECHSGDLLWGRSGGNCGSESWALNSSGLAGPQHVDSGKSASFTLDPRGQVLPTSALKKTRSRPAFISMAMWVFSGLHKTHGTKHVYIQYFLQHRRSSLASIFFLSSIWRIWFLKVVVAVLLAWAQIYVLYQEVRFDFLIY